MNRHDCNVALFTFQLLWKTWLLLVLVVASASSVAYDGSLVRQVSQGALQGAADRYNTQVFRGIPYAKPPVGDLRWRAPQTQQAWTGTRQATRFGPECAQKGSPFSEAPNPATFDQTIGSEDCLYLNIWRPQSTADNLPVFFWIHGGAQKYGSGSQPIYNGHHLAADGNVIVVTVNYRLGNLGWLYHSVFNNGINEDRSGNYAHLDLIKALQWVSSNINQFGGNPNNITIGGQSAGCFNVWGLLINPSVENLFSKALCSSGIPQGYPTYVAEPAADTALANALFAWHASDPNFQKNGITIDSQGAARAWINSQPAAFASTHLRNIPTAYLIAATPSVVMSHIEDCNVYPGGSGSCSAWGRFLGHDYNKKPMILGSVKDEGTLFAAPLMFSIDMPGLWRESQIHPATATWADLIDPAMQPTYETVSDVLSSFVNVVIDKTARHMRYTTTLDLWRYDFEWNSSPGVWKDSFEAYHGLDVAFLFGNMLQIGDLSSMSFDSTNVGAVENLSRKMRKYLGQFMENGNPNRWNCYWWGCKDADELVDWDEWTNVTCCVKRQKFKPDGAVVRSSDENWLFEFHSAYWNLNSSEEQLYDNMVDAENLSESDFDSGFMSRGE